VFALTEADARSFLLDGKDRRAGRDRDPQQVARYYTLDGGDVVAFSGHEGYSRPLKSAYLLLGRRLVFRTVPREYPGWYRLGLSTLFADVSVERGKVRLESEIEHNLLVSGQTTNEIHLEFDLANFLKLSPALREYPQLMNAYADQSQAVMHYALIERPERRATIESMALALAQGDSAAKLVETMRDPTFAELDAELEQFYKSRQRRKTLRLEVVAPATVQPPVQLTPEAVQARLAQLRKIVDTFEEMKLPGSERAVQ
jgi:hypothetical protein